MNKSQMWAAQWEAGLKGYIPRDLHIYEILECAKLWEQKIDQWLPGTGGGGKIQQRSRKDLFGVDKSWSLYLDCGGGCSTAIICQNSQITKKYELITVRKLDLNKNCILY